MKIVCSILKEYGAGTNRTKATSQTTIPDMSHISLDKGDQAPNNEPTPSLFYREVAGKAWSHPERAAIGSRRSPSRQRVDEGANDASNHLT